MLVTDTSVKFSVVGTEQSFIENQIICNDGKKIEVLVDSVEQHSEISNWQPHVIGARCGLKHLNLIIITILDVTRYWFFFIYSDIFGDLQSSHGFVQSFGV